MTRVEWAPIAAYISAAVSKDFADQQIEVYYDLLGDLDGAAVLAGAKAVLARSPYPTLPTAGAIRTAVIGMQCDSPTALEAWEVARRAVGRFGLSREREALESMHPAVAKAVRAITWRSLCDARLDELDTIRAHFLKGYEAMAQRDVNQALLPESAKHLIAGIGIEALPPPPDNRTGAEILKGIAKK